jgi:hypothetical protein
MSGQIPVQMQQELEPAPRKHSSRFHQAVALHSHGEQAQRVKPVLLDSSFFLHVLRDQVE